MFKLETIKSEVMLPRLLPRDSLVTTTTSTTTVRPSSFDYNDPTGDVNFNERLQLLTSDGMKMQMKEALQRGLPVPILTVINYLGHQEEGFRWSFDFRLAGHYCQFVLTLSLICWAWMNIFFLVIPRYGAVAMIVTGILALIAVFIYWILLPVRDLVIHLNGSIINFKMGGCYWTVFTAGFAALITGFVLLVVDLRNPGALAFDLELVEPIARAEVANAEVHKRSIKKQSSIQKVNISFIFIF